MGKATGSVFLLLAVLLSSAPFTYAQEKDLSFVTADDITSAKYTKEWYHPIADSSLTFTEEKRPNLASTYALDKKQYQELLEKNYPKVYKVITGNGDLASLSMDMNAPLQLYGANGEIEDTLKLFEAVYLFRGATALSGYPDVELKDLVRFNIATLTPDNYDQLAAALPPDRSNLVAVAASAIDSGNYGLANHLLQILGPGADEELQWSINTLVFAHQLDMLERYFTASADLPAILAYAATYDYTDVFQMEALKSVDFRHDLVSAGHTALIYATEQGNYRFTEELLKRHVDVNQRFPDSPRSGSPIRVPTALEYCTYFDSSPVIAVLLLANGAQYSQQTIDDQLSSALTKGFSSSYLEFFRSYGAYFAVAQDTGNGGTRLHYLARQYQWRNYDAQVQYLIKHGFPTDRKDDDGLLFWQCAPEKDRERLKQLADAAQAQTPTATVRVTTSATGRLFVDGIEKAELAENATGEVNAIALGWHTILFRYDDDASSTRWVDVKPTGTAVDFSDYRPPRDVPSGMMLVTGGTFIMGDTEDNIDGTDYWPPHQVSVSSFFMGKTEVTQREFEAVMGFNFSHFKGDDRPVEEVSWFDALVYCNKLSIKMGLQPVYTLDPSWDTMRTDNLRPPSTLSGVVKSVDWKANGFRLPTEAEWEYAAKGGNRVMTQQYSGFEYSGGNVLKDVAWYIKNSSKMTHPVAQKKPNALGLFDMTGNVAELCWDFHGHYPRMAQVNPRGPRSGDSARSRISRGGSWSTDDLTSSNYFRFLPGPFSRGSELGFRVVRNVSTPSER